MAPATGIAAPCAREPWRFLCAVLGSWLIHLTLGTFYCWGNITPYVTSYLRWQGHDVDYEATSRVFALAAVCFGAFMYYGGGLQHRIGLRGTALVGGWTMSLGVAASASTVPRGLPAFIATYSVLFGLGSALAYTAPIVCLMRWLPGRGGLAAGVVVLGYGAGAFIFDPLQAALANPHNLAPSRTERDGRYFDWEDPSVSEQVLSRVPGLFGGLALLYATMQALGALLLLEPIGRDAELLPGAGTPPRLQGLERPLVAAVEGSPGQYSVRDMVRTRQYWLLVANFACNSQGVFFATSCSKTFAALLVSGGLSDARLTTISAVSALFNGLGRILWGAACDRSSFRAAMAGMCCAQAALLATLPLCGSASAYCAWLCGIFLCVGGNFALFPAATATYFGQRHVGSNYGLVMLGQSFAMLWAPELARAVLAHGSGAAGLCRATAGFLLCGGLLAALNRPPSSGLEAQAPPSSAGRRPLLQL